MSCFISLKVDISGTRQDSKKWSTSINVFQAFSCEKIKNFILFVPTLIFFKLVASGIEFNLFTPFVLFPFMIMDCPVFISILNRN